MIDSELVASHQILYYSDDRSPTVEMIAIAGFPKLGGASTLRHLALPKYGPIGLPASSNVNLRRH